jgi:predicted nuclease of restriction endonuclease-like RecB superfamily
VEQKFAMKFKQFSNGWNLIREPNPLIISNGKGFIPDFAFEKYGIRIYLEIIGFWTNDYLVKKIQKIADIISLSSSLSSQSDSSGSKSNQGVNVKGTCNLKVVRLYRKKPDYKIQK